MTPDASPIRGEIWMVDWSPGRGSEQQGYRPALVVQTDAANRNSHYPNTIVVAVSSKGRAVPFHIALTPDAYNGLTLSSFIKCEQVMTCDKGRLVRRLGVISHKELAAVDAALKLVLGIR